MYNDTAAKVFDGLQILDHLTKVKTYNEPMVRKSTQLRNTIVSEGKLLSGRAPPRKQGG